MLTSVLGTFETHGQYCENARQSRRIWASDCHTLFISLFSYLPVLVQIAGDHYKSFNN